MKRALLALALVMALPLLARADDRQTIVFTADDGPESILAVVRIIINDDPDLVIGHVHAFAQVFLVGEGVPTDPFTGQPDPGAVEAAVLPDGTVLVMGAYWLLFDPVTGEYSLLSRWSNDPLWEGEGRVVVAS